MEWAVELGIGRWFVIAGAAGLVGLDGTSWPQAMISRPLVAATVGGWLLGDPAGGLVAGAVLELLFLRHLPYGGARCPDAGPASLVAGGGYAALSGPDAVALAAAAGAGWALGWLGEITVRGLRRVAGRVMSDTAPLARRPDRLERRHRILLGADFLRGGLLGAVFLVPTVALVRVTAGMAGPDEARAAAVLLALAVGTAAGAAARRLTSARRQGLLLAAGALAAVVLARALA